MVFERNAEIDARQITINESDLNRYITKVFGWTFLGLLTTAAMVIFFITGAVVIPGMAQFLITALNYMLFISIAQIVLVFFIARKIETLKPSTAKLLYLLYSASMGILFTWVAIVYDLATIGLAFAITAVSFGTMAVYGLVTKKDLTKMGPMLFMGLIGLIIAIVANMFMNNSTLDLIICVAGLFIFLALTVYDTNRIKTFYAHSVDENGEATALTENLAILSALGLYLNFINIFLFILRLLSRD